MIQRDTIVKELDELYDTFAVDDYSFNGLQYEGKEDVHTIAYAVDMGVEVSQKAAEAKADLLIVHHGVYWKGADPRIEGVMKKRLTPCIEQGISLYASHLPMDMHETIGHNVTLVRYAGAELSGRFSPYGKRFIGALGSFEKAQNVEEIQARLDAALQSDSKLVVSGTGVVKKIAVLSGAAGRSMFHEAVSEGVDLFITGEQSELYHDAMDYGVSLLFLGHHCSEKAGLIELQRVMTERFPQANHIFLDNPTGL